MLDTQIKFLAMIVQSWMRLDERVADERDRGEVTATTALIVLLVAAAIAAGAVIASRITSNANSIPSP